MGISDISATDLLNLSAGRIGDWFQTYTGKKVYPLDLRPEDVCIEDVAHSLSLQCRFAGHVRQLYVVANHCVLAARYVDVSIEGDSFLETAAWKLGEREVHRILRLASLLHDASETYCQDLIRPIKRMMPEYVAAENRIADVIGLKYIPELPGIIHHARIKDIDNRLLATEKRDLLAVSPAPWRDQAEPLPITIVPVSPGVAEDSFLQAFDALSRPAQIVAIEGSARALAALWAPTAERWREDLEFEKRMQVVHPVANDQDELEPAIGDVEYGPKGAAE